MSVMKVNDGMFSHNIDSDIETLATLANVTCLMM